MVLLLNKAKEPRSRRKTCLRHVSRLREKVHGKFWMENLMERTSCKTQAQMGGYYRNLSGNSRMGESVQDYSISRQRHQPVACEHGDETSVFIKLGIFVGYRRNYQLVKRHSAPRSQRFNQLLYLIHLQTYMHQNIPFCFFVCLFISIIRFRTHKFSYFWSFSRFIFSCFSCLPFFSFFSPFHLFLFYFILLFSSSRSLLIFSYISLLFFGRFLLFTWCLLIPCLSALSVTLVLKSTSFSLAFSAGLLHFQCTRK